jgi:hypothetical protein
MANNLSVDRPEAGLQAPARAAALDNGVFLACGLAWSAGLIHLAAAVDHVDEYVPFAVFFFLLAPAQLALGVALYRRPTRRLLRAGALGSMIVVAIWVVSRTSGVPIGPTPWVAEPAGLLDCLASADEAVLALLVLYQLRSDPGPLLVRCSRPLLTAAGVGLILLSSLALAGGGHAH